MLSVFIFSVTMVTGIYKICHTEWLCCWEASANVIYGLDQFVELLKWWLLHLCNNTQGSSQGNMNTALKLQKGCSRQLGMLIVNSHL